MHIALRTLIQQPVLRVLLLWALVMVLLLHLLQKSREAIEHEAAQRASSAAQALAARFDGLFAQTRQWSEELQRIITPEELMGERPPPESRMAELAHWIDDLRRVNPVIANLGFLDAQGRSYRQRAAGGTGLTLAQADYWQALQTLGPAGRGQLVASLPHRLRTTGQLGVVHAHGIYGGEGRLVGAVVIGLHLSELEQRLHGLAGGRGGVAALIDRDYRLIAREPALRSEAPQRLAEPRKPGPLPGTYRVVSSVDGVSRLSAVLQLRNAPYLVSVSLAEDDYLAGWQVYRRDIGLAIAALTLATAGLVLLLRRSARAEQALAQTEGALGLSLDLLPSACLHAGGEPLRVLHANAAARQLLGLAEREQPPLAALFDDAAAGQALIAEARRHGSADPQDLRLRRGNDESFWAHVQARAQAGQGGMLLSLIDIEARRQREEDLLRLSGTDALTGLPNRRAFLDASGQLMAQCRRQGEPMAVLMLDLDHFKAVNDRFGHPGGDTVLRAVAARLRGQRRGSDVIARIGGEEFACLLPNTPPEAAEGVARRLLNHLRSPAIELSAGIALQVTASIGLTAWLNDEDDIEWALARADAALYRAKANGRDRYEVER